MNNTPTKPELVDAYITMYLRACCIEEKFKPLFENEMARRNKLLKKIQPGTRHYFV